MKPYIVAELGASHKGGIKEAYALIDAAIYAGADAVKLQTWTPGAMCVDKDYVIESGAWAGRNLAQLYEEAHLPWDYQSLIFHYCRAKGIECFSSPFDRASVDFLEKLRCPRYKIASFEMIDYELITYAASKGKPVIISTGMANQFEIDHAMQAANAADDVTLLVCTSEYPAKVAEAPLHMLKSLSDRHGCTVGVSDHSIGNAIAIAATALGVSMIEKHLCLSRTDGSLDAGFSLLPEKFKQMVDACNDIHRALLPKEINRKSSPLRRSLYAARHLPKGHIITAEDLCTARPALGLHPSFYSTIIGKTISQELQKNQPITNEGVI